MVIGKGSPRHVAKSSDRRRASQAENFGDRLAAGVDVQFLIDALDDGHDRIAADAEFVGDLLVGQTL